MANEKMSKNVLNLDLRDINDLNNFYYIYVNKQYYTKYFVSSKHTFILKKQAMLKSNQMTRSIKVKNNI